jgi:hypothetical protein
MNLEIVKNDRITNTELLDRINEGHSVVRTAHCGNLRPYNLGLASMGVTMQLLDTNVTGIDRTYIPEKKISISGSKTLHDRIGSVVMRAETNGEFLDDYHTKSISDAFPETPVYTFTDYFRKNKTIVEKIIEAGFVIKPDMFKRSLGDGAVQATQHTESPDSIPNIIQLSDNPRTDEGYLLPNELATLAGFIIESIKTGNKVQYHVSGPDMIRYIDSIAPVMQEVLNHVVNKNTIPELSKAAGAIEIVFIPGSEMRFVAPNEMRYVLDEMIEYFATLKITFNDAKDQRSAFFSGNGSSNKDEYNLFMDQIRYRENDALNTFLEVVAKNKNLVSFDANDHPVTQYDLTDSGVYVPEYSMNTPYSKFKIDYDEMAKYLKIAKKRALK